MFCLIELLFVLDKLRSQSGLNNGSTPLLTIGKNQISKEKRNEQETYKERDREQDGRKVHQERKRERSILRGVSQTKVRRRQHEVLHKEDGQGRPPRSKLLRKERSFRVLNRNRGKAWIA